MRHCKSLCLTAAIGVALSCKPPSDATRTSPAQIVGRVTDAYSGAPLKDVSLSVDKAPFASTDSAGWYDLYWEAGSHVISINERGFLSQELEHVFRAGTTDTLNVSLLRANPPCCHMEGKWRVELRRIPLGVIRFRPFTKTISGEVYFSDTIPDPIGLRKSYRSLDDRALGYFDVPFSRFFGSQIAADVSTTVVGGSPDTLEREVLASVFAGDSVELSFIPRVSHGGVTLLGRLKGDSVIGTWYLRAYAVGSRGDFIMVRANSPGRGQR